MKICFDVQYKPSKMTIRQAIKRDFNIDLPIGGGKGNSRNDPLIIEYDGKFNDYVYYEHQFVKFICIGRRLMEWKIVGQTLLRYNGKDIDQIKFTHIEIEEGIRYVVTENCYFDITACFGVEPFN